MNYPMDSFMKKRTNKELVEEGYNLDKSPLMKEQPQDHKSPFLTLENRFLMGADFSDLDLKFAIFKNVFKKPVILGIADEPSG